MRRATRRLGLACDNRCVFCAVRDEKDASAPEDLAALRALSDEITFVGGEPLLAANLVDEVAAARAAGFVRVGVQTNGRHLAALAPSLAGAGLTDVHVSLHGATAACHDWHTGVAGSFAETLAGIAAARAAGLTVVATTLLTRSTMRALAEVPWFARARDVAAWCVATPIAVGAAARAFDAVMPRLGLAVPFALHAVEAARKLGLPAWIAGAPACLLGPLADRALPVESRAHGAACAGCGARPACPGVDAAYLGRFAGDELAARDAIASNSILSDSEAALARMFVGPGAAPALSDTIAPSPSRRSLPLLRPAPARAEVSAATPRRSGAALGALFPSLFEGDEEG